MGMLLVLLSGLCLGLSRASELKRREKLLIDLKRMIQALRTGIEFSARPLEELINGLEEFPFCRLARKESMFLAEPKAALEQAGEKLLKTPEDLELYRGFVRGLGESGLQGQLEHIDLYAALLERNLARADEERERKTRLYVCLGLFGGAVLCLVLA